ncbi:MAG TPA: rhomboid family intramembrane serine protease [Deltaproteobacteria bacterium]|nr:rhomboid family intramembrane serine protease [Deltaproteobacteria bacterium]
MIPLKDNIATRTFPIITVSILFVNMLIFVVQALFLPSHESEMYFKYYGLIPGEFLIALSRRWDLIPYNILTVFTSMFIHGGLFHAVGNMLYLWIFGNNVEDSMGHMRFIVFYFLSGIVAATFQFFYDPHSAIPMVGASGAVSGILGAYLVLYPYARVKTLLFIFVFIKIVELPAILLLTIWFFIQVLYSHMGGVAWHAHIGGFIFGLLSIRSFRKKGGRS